MPPIVRRPRQAATTRPGLTKLAHSYHQDGSVYVCARFPRPPAHNGNAPNVTQLLNAIDAGDPKAAEMIGL